METACHAGKRSLSPVMSNERLIQRDIEIEQGQPGPGPRLISACRAGLDISPAL